MNPDSDSREEAGKLTPGTIINPPAEKEVETAKAEKAQEESKHSDNELSVLVYRAHISRGFYQLI